MIPESGVAAPSQYRLVRVEGTHRELGRQHGEQAAEQIKAHVDLMQRSRGQLQSQALRFRPLFEKYCPHLLDEIGAWRKGRASRWQRRWRWISVANCERQTRKVAPPT